MKTIDVTAGATSVLPQSWAEVAQQYNVHPKAIERDRAALGRHNDPINRDLLKEIGLMRRWLALGNGGRSRFNRPNFIDLKNKGLLEAQLQAAEACQASK
jgi:hypothetical protein